MTRDEYIGVSIAGALLGFLVARWLISETTEPIGSGIDGLIVEGPTCPDISMPLREGCQDAPMPGITVIISAGGGMLDATSGPDGRFRVALDPGTYLLTPSVLGSGLGAAPAPFTVTVAPGAYTPVGIKYDTGIR